MKVLIVKNMKLFVRRKVDELAAHLKENLISGGHSAEILSIPFQCEPYTIILSQMLLARTLELSNVDRVIALEFPAYLIRHPHKTLWLLDKEHYNIPKIEQSNEIKNLIFNAENQSLQEMKKIYTHSLLLQKRLKQYNKFDSELLCEKNTEPFSERYDVIWSEIIERLLT